MPRHFTPKMFSFLRDLADNNDREWFAANKDRYETDVREPALDFIEDFADRLLKISPNFSADPRKQGGSMFRIHRDTRFSKDKTPYKIHTGMQFRHVATKDDVHAALDAAHAALPGWASTPAPTRGQIIGNMARLLLDLKDDIVRLVDDCWWEDPNTQELSATGNCADLSVSYGTAGAWCSVPGSGQQRLCATL